MAGQNVGYLFAEAARFDRTAYDLKELHTQLKDCSNQELKQIPIIKAGSRLKQGAKYTNLNDTARREFTATGKMEADSHNI